MATVDDDDGLIERVLCFVGTIALRMDSVVVGTTSTCSGCASSRSARWCSACRRSISIDRSSRHDGSGWLVTRLRPPRSEDAQSFCVNAVIALLSAGDPQHDAAAHAHRAGLALRGAAAAPAIDRSVDRSRVDSRRRSARGRRAIGRRWARRRGTTRGSPNHSVVTRAPPFPLPPRIASL